MDAVGTLPLALYPIVRYYYIRVRQSELRGGTQRLMIRCAVTAM
jgi:hypothetical protein